MFFVGLMQTTTVQMDKVWGKLVKIDHEVSQSDITC